MLINLTYQKPLTRKPSIAWTWCMYKSWRLTLMFFKIFSIQQAPLGTTLPLTKFQKALIKAFETNRECTNYSDFSLLWNSGLFLRPHLRIARPPNIGTNFFMSSTGCGEICIQLKDGPAEYFSLFISDKFIHTHMLIFIL